MVQIIAEEKSTQAEVSEQTSSPQNFTPDGSKESGVKSTNAKKNSKEEMAQISAEKKSTQAKVSEQTPAPQNGTPDRPKKSGVKSTKAQKKAKEIAPLTEEKKTSTAEPKEKISVPQKVTPGGFKKSEKKSRGKKGAAIQAPDDPNKKTPYQGSHRACGLFRCLDCKKGWFSPHTWANTYQICKGCNAKIYPYAQFKPEKAKGPMKTTPPHPRHLCQMCMKHGIYCGSLSTKKAANRQREE